METNRRGFLGMLGAGLGAAGLTLPKGPAKAESSEILTPPPVKSIREIFEEPPVIRAPGPEPVLTPQSPTGIVIPRVAIYHFEDPKAPVIYSYAATIDCVEQQDITKVSAKVRSIQLKDLFKQVEVEQRITISGPDAKLRIKGTLVSVLWSIIDQRWQYVTLDFLWSKPCEFEVLSYRDALPQKASEERLRTWVGSHSDLVFGGEAGGQVGFPRGCTIS